MMVSINYVGESGQPLAKKWNWATFLHHIRKETQNGTHLVVQWLRFCASNSGGTGSIPGQGAKIPHATWCGQNIEINK